MDQTVRRSGGLDKMHIKSFRSVLWSPQAERKFSRKRGTSEATRDTLAKIGEKKKLPYAPFLLLIHASTVQVTVC